MGIKTGISWTEATWNPIRGCRFVSDGCSNCYAASVATRFSGIGQPYEGLARLVNGKPNWTGRVRVVHEHLYDPLHWQRPRLVFVNSMSDLFFEPLSDDMIALICAVMALAQRHTFQVLTKRPERMQLLLSDRSFATLVWAHADQLRLDPLIPFDRRGCHRVTSLYQWPLPNVWMGVSVEAQRVADERIPYLLDTPAAVRFLSCEPLLDAIDLRPYLRHAFNREPHCSWCEDCIPLTAGRDWWKQRTHDQHSTFIDWVIEGGESGPRHRPMLISWARRLRDQCVASNTAFYFKQWGGATSKAGGKRLDDREWCEYPAVAIASV